jgi:hypothetical protein
LLDARIGNAGNLADLGQQGVGVSEIGAEIALRRFEVDRPLRSRVASEPR